MINATQSKQKRLTQSVNETIIQDTDMMDQIIEDEVSKIHQSGEIDDFLQELEAIKQEVNHHLVKDLLDLTIWDEALCIEREEQESKRNFE